uniref:Replication protein A 70 kDa DNA-binding subunit A-like isoform X5 n=1 Tax=Nicotiana tabacum TaxID=4097 RepID=A0A1S4D716_TOBAC|nr:PREDICTED: replication protein A 70 kDa DNA-binding subunit A-like isoform X5 [Nicotiana tabacum]
MNLNLQGDRIHGTIGKYVLKFFRNKIHELRLYRMNYFVVGPNNLKLRTTTHKLKLTFTQKTFVEETNDPSFHMNIFNLRPFHQLTNEHDVDETELLDVVGQVVTYEDVKTYNQGDDQSFLINVVLEDDQNRIMATLWSELVDQIQHHLNESADEPLIVVFPHMKPQKYRGNYSVRSCWYQTKIWINSTLPQSIEFKSRLLAPRQSNIERIIRTSSQQSYSVRDELDKGIVLFKTIRDLVQCTQESSYWIAAKLVNLELDRGWSYLACNKCSRKVEKVGNKYFCAKCNEEESSVTHRYRLQVRVMDGTAFISLLLWNREAMQLIGKSAKELKERLVEDPHFLDGQSSSGDKLFGDLMAESQLKSVLKTPIEKSVSESGSPVLDDGDACNAKISPLKTYDKKTRSANKASAVATDDDFNSQLSSNKVRRVVKKEKNP